MFVAKKKLYKFVANYRARATIISRAIDSTMPLFVANYQVSMSLVRGQYARITTQIEFVKYET